MNKITQITSLLAVGLLVGTLTAQAQLTWDITPGAVGAGNGTIETAAGTWDIVNGNWTSDAGVNNVAWVAGNNATFGDAGADYTIDIADGGVTVGNLTFTGTDVLQFKSVTDNLGVITIATGAGGATWDTGGGEIEFVNDGVNDTGLSITSGDTLTIQGGGTFNAGVAALDVPWVAAGATLDFTAATSVLGDSTTVGQFGTVKFAGGSTYTATGGAARTYANDWDLGTGTFTFTSDTSNLFYAFNGDVTGAGRLRVEDLGLNNQLVLKGTGSTFSGGLEIDNSRVQINAASVLGATPGSFDADNIKIMNGGQFRIAQGTTLDANRGITIENGATIEATGGTTTTIGGAITGTGGLTFGRAGQAQGTYALTGNSDYTGGTTIYEGLVALGADEALGEGVVTIGGEGTSKLVLAGNSQTVGGITTAGNNTREIVNQNNGSAASGTAGTLIIDVPDGESHTFGSAYGVGSVSNYGNFSTVKNGLGTQQINNMQVGGDLTVNNGLLVINDANAVSAGAASVTGGTLRINDSLTSASYATSGTGTLQIGNGGTTGNIANANISNDGAVIVSRSNASSYSGVISGTGSVKFTGGGTPTLAAAQTYTGDTTIDKSILTAGVDNALSADSALMLGAAGTGTSVFEMNGFDQEIGGLGIVAGSHTRAVDNNGLGTDVTLTINVATGESYAFNANVRGTDIISIVKSGDGTQTINRAGGYTKPLGDLTVTAGELIWSTTNPAALTGAVLVTGGNLEVTESLSVTDFTVSTGATSSFAFKVTDWAGVAQTDYNQVAASGELSVTDAASYTIVIDDANLTDFMESTASFTIATAVTMSATDAEFALDVSAFTLGTGTWSVAVVSNDVILTYTSTAATGYAAWSGGADFDVDTNGDGVDNGLAFLLGAADVNANAIDLLPTSTESGGDLVMTFSVLNAATRGTAELAIEHSNDLTGLWSTATTVPETSSTVDDIVFAVTPDGDMNDVIATIPSTKAAGGKLFGRVVGTNP